MKLKSVLPSVWALFLLLIVMASCNEDFETLGSEIVSDQGLEVFLNDEVSIIAYNKKLPPVQSNGLSKYQLGVYNDPVYGSTTVDLVSQLILSETEPNFRNEPLVDSVTIYIPFFSTVASTSGEETTYTLDSIYGNAPVKLEVFENNYYLRSLDPEENFEEPQQYFSDQGSLFDDFLGISLFTIDELTPTTDEIIEVVPNEDEDEDDEVIRSAPGIRVVFDATDDDATDDAQIAFFQEKIIDNEDNEVLISNNNFTNFFRGLNFQITPLSNEGTLFGVDLQNAVITIHYSFLLNDDSTTRDTDTFDLSFNGVIVNTYENNFNASILNEIENTNATLGDDNIYLKGGEGSMGIIELFGNQDILSYEDGQLINQPNDVPDELDIIRERGWLINEANLIFYVNQDIVTGGSLEPERILIYDIENARALADYNLDPTQSRAPVIESYTNHLGPLERGDDDNGDFYKIRITNHINNLVKRDSINRKLGLAVIQQPSQIRLQTLQSERLTTVEREFEPIVERIPEATVESLEGTVLYGNTTPNEEKRLKLQIYYTDPNQ